MLGELPFPTTKEDSFEQKLQKLPVTNDQRSMADLSWQDLLGPEPSQGISWKLESDQEKHVKRLEILHEKAKTTPKFMASEELSEDEISYNSEHSMENADPDAAEVVAVNEGLWLLWKQDDLKYSSSEAEQSSSIIPAVGAMVAAPTPVYKSEGQFLGWLDRIGLVCCFSSYAD